MSGVDPKTLMNLDECVIEALKLFANPGTRLPEMEEFPSFKRPLVVGSGNAAVTGRITYADEDAVFADESTYQEKLSTISAIDGVVLVSASGEKHAPGIVQAVQARGQKPPEKETPLLILTCNNGLEVKLNEKEETKIRKGIDKIITFPWNPEPYTYNTSTYMGMILTKTREDPAAILKHIRQAVDPALREFGAHFASFDAYFLLVPEELDSVRPMLSTKFVELFGRQVARDVFTKPQAMHATTLVPCDTELFLSFGVENEWWGTPEQRLHIPLPANAGHAALMAVGYYVIGKIQTQKLPFFKMNAASYCEKEAPKWFGRELPVVVRYG